MIVPLQVVGNIMNDVIVLGMNLGKNPDAHTAFR